MAAMLIGVASFSFMDACLKLLSTDYPPMQVAALRGLAALPIVFAWVLYAGGVQQLVRVRWPLHLIRGVLSVFMMTTFVVRVAGTVAGQDLRAVLRRALADRDLLHLHARRAHSARAVAGHRHRIRRRADRARPTRHGRASAGRGPLAVLGTAVCYALSSVLVKIIGRTDSTQAMVFWMTCMLAIGATTLALPDWQPIRSEHYLIIGGIAFTGAIGQWGITEAFKRAPAASVAPLEYSGLAWVIMIDLVVWSVVPEWHTLAGRRGDHRQRALSTAV